MAPWLLLGFVAAGLIGITVSKQVVARNLTGTGFLPLIKATLFGVPLPLCSCSVIPTGIGFHKHGAHTGPTVSFLTATPQTGIDSLFVTASAFGWPFTLLKVATAIISGLIGGALAGADNKATDDENTPTETTSNRWNTFCYLSLKDLPGAIAIPFTIGVLINALLGFYVDAGSLGAITGNGPLVYAAVLLFSIPLYVCSTASIPLAMALMDQGLEAGVVLVFLLAGPATNFATMLIIGKTLGIRALSAYLGTIITVSVLAGYFLGSMIAPQASHIQHHNHESLFPHIAGIILLLIFIPSYSAACIRFLSRFKKSKQISTNTPRQHYALSGLSCHNCVNKARTTLQKAGITIIAIDAESLEITGPQDHAVITALFTSIGFSAELTTQD